MNTVILCWATSETTDHLIIHCPLDSASCLYDCLGWALLSILFSVITWKFSFHGTWGLRAEMEHMKDLQEHSLEDILTVQNVFRFSKVDFMDDSSVLF